MNKLQEKVADFRDEIERLIEIKENQADEADAIGNHLISEELDDDVLLLHEFVIKTDSKFNFNVDNIKKSTNFAQKNQETD